MDSKIQALLEWIKNTIDENEEPSTHSYISPKITVRDHSEWGRNICAVQDICRQELLIRIPPSFLLNFTTVLKHITSFSNVQLTGAHYSKIYVPKPRKLDHITEIYSQFDLPHLTDLSSFQIVALYITLESQRRQHSYWGPFFDMLPDMDDFKLNPLVWHVLGKDKQLLHYLPPSTIKHCNKVIERFESDYNIVCKLMTELANGKYTDSVSSIIPLNTFLWAWLCINSRCLYMEIPEKKNNADNFTMAPYVDFLNHSSEDQCILKIDNYGFQVISGVNYTTNDQVFLSYGPHSNEFLLCEYGFMLNDNKWNDIDITSYLSRALSESQVEFLKENDYYGEYTINVLSGPSFRTEVALATLQESNPHRSRKLTALVNGMLDISAYEINSKILLTEISHQVLKDLCEVEYQVEDDEITRLRKDVIKKLQFDIKRIIESLNL